MNIAYAGKWFVLVAGLLCGLAAASEANQGALITLRVSSEAPPEAGAVRRSGLESSVLVAFNEKFAMQAATFRVELTAVDEAPSAGVTVTLFDARAQPPVFVGTERVAVPNLGMGTARMTGTDGTSYSVSVQFRQAVLPAAKP